MGRNIDHENRDSFNVYTKLDDQTRKDLAKIQTELCLNNAGVAEKALRLFVEWGLDLLNIKNGKTQLVAKSYKTFLNES